MATRVTFQGQYHWVAKGKVASWHPARQFLKAFDLEPQQHVAVWDNNSGNAFLRYDVKDGVLWPGGTWVAPKLRGQGIAMKLWIAVMKREKPCRVQVRTASRGGRALICALAKKYHKVEWEILT